VLHLGQHCQVVAAGKRVSSVLESGKELERLLEAIRNGIGWAVQCHAATVERACDSRSLGAA